MASGASRRARHFGVDSIAGWVFADLFLVLFIVGLGSAVSYTPPEPPPPPPKVAPIVGMETDPAKITIVFDAAAAATGNALTGQPARAVCKAVRGQLQPLEGKRAALVLVFGGGPEVSVGQNVARAAAGQLGCASDRVFGPKVPSRAFWDGTLPLGQVRLEVFLFVTRGHPQ